MSTKRSAILACSGLLVVAVAYLHLHPAWEPPAHIRDSILQVTPLGTSMSEVRSLAERKGWLQPDVHVDTYTAFGTGTPVAASALSGQLRHDPWPYRTSVRATWEFNGSNQLVNISVLRHE
jgi:hypothetical protein